LIGCANFIQQKLQNIRNICPTCQECSGPCQTGYSQTWL